jgi:hypothetical protein
MKMKLKKIERTQQNAGLFIVQTKISTTNRCFCVQSVVMSHEREKRERFDVMDNIRDFICKKIALKISEGQAEAEHLLKKTRIHVVSQLEY